MSAVIPVNPQDINNVATTTDYSIVNSVTGGGAVYGNGEAPVVTSNSHPVVSRADGALWDYTSGVYVAIQNTSIGTTAVPKNGQ